MSRIRLPSSGSAFKRLKHVGIFQAENELAVGELIDAGELHFDDAAQQGRQGRPEVAAEALMQRLQCPHLLFADSLRAFEVIGGDLFAAFAASCGASAPSSAGGPPSRSARRRTRIAFNRFSTSAWLSTSVPIARSLSR